MLFALGSPKLNDHSSHIVSANALGRFQICGHAVIEQGFNAFSQFGQGAISVLQHEIILVAFVVNVVYHLLVAHYIPNSITSQNYELCVALDRGNLDFGKGGNSLFLGPHALISFVVEVAKGSREGQHSLDARCLHKGVSSVNAAALV